MQGRLRSLWLILALCGTVGFGGGQSGCTVQEGDAVADAPIRGEGRSQSDELAGPQSQAERRRANRLARENSPYLLLHAHNPVDWYPWGPEAFEKARRENKPIFLSIGYSSCHWCHVMERLVFSDEKISRSMNEHFVNVKVDREERPDIDDIYMTAVIIYFQLIGSKQGGGWPLSVFLTPDGKPFAGGTYFPPEDDDDRLGFPSVMKRVIDLWENRREDVLTNANLLTDQVRRAMRPKFVLQPAQLDRELVHTATQTVMDSYDSLHGGLGFHPDRPDAPKFPVASKLALLQYEVRRHGNEQAARILAHTLDAMAAGGIHDHLGGGFHRYSTDRAWHVPHFEKMLYDQAQLADAYVEAYRQTNKARYREVAELTFDYVLREMTDPRGGFHSALDAETRGIEGEYYVWSKKEVEEILGRADAPIFLQAYGMREPNRFEPGYVLHLPHPLHEVAEQNQIPAHELKHRLAEMRQKLLDARNQRVSPLKDDKVLTSWNGLMIRSLANAGAVLGRQDYLKASERAALFILAEMRDDDGRLQRSYRDGEAKLNAYLDDYAFLVDGLLALHLATRDPKWLNAARRLTDDQIELFWDEQGSGFYFTAHHHEELIARTKTGFDTVLPAGNSVSVRNLIRIASLCGEDQYRQRAEDILERFAPILGQSPGGMSQMALAVGEFLDNPDFSAARTDRFETDPLAVRPAVNVIENDLAADEAGGTSTVPSDSGVQTVSGEALALREPNRPSTNGRRTSQNDDDEDEAIVTAKAFLSVDRLPAGGFCQIVLFLDIQDGWHINTNPAQPDFFVPTTFTIKTKRGTRLARVSYPEGKKLRIPGLDEPQHVYDGQIAIRGLLEIPSDAGGETEEFELIVRYQPCNDQTCLSPTTASLKGKVAVAPEGESVRSINQKLFPKPKPSDESPNTEPPLPE